MPTAPYRLPDGSTVEAPVPPSGYRLHHVKNNVVTPPLGGNGPTTLVWNAHYMRWEALHYMNPGDTWYATRS